MRSNDKKPNGFGIKALQNFPNGEEVAQRLGHFFVVHPHKAVVHPHIGHGLSMSPFALCDFVFVVGKLQVCAATMNVKVLTEQIATHGRTFNMPTRTPQPEGAGPLRLWRLGGFGRLPQHKVERVFFVARHTDPLARAQLV